MGKRAIDSANPLCVFRFLAPRIEFCDRPREVIVAGNICDDQRSPLQDRDMPEVTSSPKPAASTSPYTRAIRSPANSSVNRRLSGPESEKETRHFEIDLTGWGVEL